MHDDTVSSWLGAVEPVWSGHKAALAGRLARPAAARLTEEQEALALGMAQRLILALASKLPLASEAGEIWSRWESGGLPGSAALAPILLARVEEYRWRRHQPQPPATAPNADGVSADAEIAFTAEETEPSETELAYLHLRIADGARSTAIGQPLLLQIELPATPLRTLLLDIAAQDLALVGGANGRAEDLACTIDAVLAEHGAGSIDAAGQRYHRALQAAEILSEAAVAALVRRDWLALIALIAAEHRVGFARIAAALVGARDDQILSALAPLGVNAHAAGPLLDALADLAGRPERGPPPLAARADDDTIAAIAARAADLRGDGT